MSFRPPNPRASRPSPLARDPHSPVIHLRAVLSVLFAPSLLAAGWLTSDSLEGWLEGDDERARLPSELQEVSGLALDASGRLWAHDDERGIIYRLEDSGDAILERRVLGPEPLRGDFEGLAWDGRRFHLTTSTGTLVSFEPGTTESVAGYAVRRTAADDICEVEGLMFDPDTDRLLMACKTVIHRPWRRHLAILEVAIPGEGDDLEMPRLPVAPRALVTPDQLDEADIGRISPSGLTAAPDGDGWWVVAARQRRIVHISATGHVVDHERLPSRHRQAEGVMIEAPAVLTIVDEGGDGRARITRYTPAPPDDGRP